MRNYKYKCDNCHEKNKEETVTIKLTGLPDLCNYEEYRKECADEYYKRKLEYRNQGVKNEKNLQIFKSKTRTDTTDKNYQLETIQREPAH